MQQNIFKSDILNKVILNTKKSVSLLIFNVRRLRKTWLENVDADIAELEIDREDINDRRKWRCYEEKKENLTAHQRIF